MGGASAKFQILTSSRKRVLEPRLVKLRVSLSQPQVRTEGPPGPDTPQALRVRSEGNTVSLVLGQTFFNGEAVKTKSNKYKVTCPGGTGL